MHDKKPSKPKAPPQKQGHAAREMAWRMLRGVLDEGRSLLDQRMKFKGVSGPDQARALGLVNDYLRQKSRIDALLATYLDRPPAVAPLAVLQLAATELLIRGEAAHGVVDGAVSLLRSDQKMSRYAGLANAVLRKVATEGPDKFAALPKAEWPEKLRNAIKDAYGIAALEAMETVCAAPAPVDITLKRAGWTGISGAKPLPTGGLRLQEPGQVTALPGFDEGAWWVQDAAAAIPVQLMGDVKGKNVLDLCAAPGGKTMQLAAAGAAVTAVDLMESRMHRVRENLKRTKLMARLKVADALTYMPEDQPDAVLLDAPCSATGTIRRHPDLPYLKEGWDLRPLLRLQARLLNKAAGVLQSGGILIYVTCSLWPEEGEAQIAAFLDRQKAFRADAIDPADFDLPAEAAAPHGALRLRPDFWAETGGMDGFYIARLVKR